MTKIHERKMFKLTTKMKILRIFFQKCLKIEKNIYSKIDQNDPKVFKLTPNVISPTLGIFWYLYGGNYLILVFFGIDMIKNLPGVPPTIRL